MTSRYDPKHHRRQPLRFKGYDYTQAGLYFVTLFTQGRQLRFGDIAQDKMPLNHTGQLVAEAWEWPAVQYPYVALDKYVIMPNHLHSLIAITDHARGGSRTAPTSGRKPLGRLIGAFKTVASKRVNLARKTLGQPVWQRNYHEHVVRDDESLMRIRQYILDNPARWHFDRENPLGSETGAGG